MTKDGSIKQEKLDDKLRVWWKYDDTRTFKLIEPLGRRVAE